MSYAKLNPKLIGTIDLQINDMMNEGHTKNDILKRLHRFTPTVLSMIEHADPKQLELYTNAYQGFHCYLVLVLRRNWN